MNYYLKFGSYFFSALIWFAISIRWLVKSYINDSHALPWFWIICTLFFGFHLIKFLYRKLTKKPALIVNGSYILDNLNSIKYNWEDICEVVETTNFLYIYLYDPRKYLLKINNPLRRLEPIISLYFFKKRTPYQIGLHQIRIEDKKEFLEKLNEYSTASQG